MGKKYIIDKPIRLIELFGGIGAPRKALQKMGCNVKSIDYVEIDEAVVKSYNAVFGENFKAQDIKKYDIKEKVDLVFHGSPCQDFSQGGFQKGGEKESGTRSSLLWETIRVIQKNKPTFVIWENVKNVNSNKHKKIFNDYLLKMEELGYTNYYQQLNALDFDIPQTRPRIFTVSILGNYSFIFPTKLVKTTKLKDFLDLENNDWKQETNFKTFSNFYTIPRKSDGKLINGSYNRIWNIDNYIGTIPASVKNKIGFIKNKILYYREITSKEAWMLMGFDIEDYEKARQVCTESQLYKQAGNSIVVNVLMAIFKELL